MCGNGSGRWPPTPSSSPHGFTLLCRTTGEPRAEQRQRLNRWAGPQRPADGLLDLLGFFLLGLGTQCAGYPRASDTHSLADVGQFVTQQGQAGWRLEARPLRAEEYLLLRGEGLGTQFGGGSCGLRAGVYPHRAQVAA